MKMKSSLKIPFIITMVVFMTGGAIIVNRGIRSVALPANFIPIWLAASIVLAGISVWSYQHFKDK